MLARVLPKIGQALFIWAAETLALVFLARTIPGLDPAGGGSWPREFLIVPALALGLANAVVRPLLIAATIPMGVLGFGTIAAGLNGILLLVMDSMGFLDISGLPALFLSAVALAVINTVLTTILSIDEEDRFYRKVIRKLASSSSDRMSNSPGLLIVEIDGLAYVHLQEARAKQRMPALESLLRDGDNSLTAWDCGIPSQTSSSQAGIMYGNNFDIPAFRWFERERGRLVVSGNAKDAKEIEERVSQGHGLLTGGSSVNNLLSGDAQRVALTLSEIGRKGMERGTMSGEVLKFFFDPYCLTRALILVSWEMLVQVVQSIWATVRKGRGFQGHGTFYPLQRALSTVLLRDLSTFLVVRDLMRGSPAIYVSYVGYDVIAHHHGPQETIAFGVLSAIDRQIGRLIEVARRRAPRPYHVVLLSDHGQSPGQSFLAKHGVTLTSLVQGLISGPQVGEVRTVHPRYLEALLREMERSEEMPTLGRARRRALRRGRLYLEKRLEQEIPGMADLPESRVEVCCSGNLAHIYLPGKSAPFFLEEINELYPDLIPGLLNHPGIGFLMVRSAGKGLLVLGLAGLRKLESGEVDGEDPLLALPKPMTAADQLHRLGKFPHAGDIVVNSTFHGGRVTSFEEQVGSHGGMGGPQNYPFLILPKSTTVPCPQIFSSEQLYPILLTLRSSMEEIGEKAG